MRKLFALFLLVNLVGFSQELNNPEPLEIINSLSDEVAPILSDGGNTLYFVRVDHEENYYGGENSQDIWVSKKTEDGSWSQPIRISAEFNNARSKSFVWASEDGTRFFLTGTYTKSGKWKGRGLSEVMSLGEDRWTMPEEVKLKGFKKMSKGKTCNVHLVRDESVMLLSFSKKWDKVPNKLFLSKKKKKGWGKPSRINGPFKHFKSIDAPC